MHTRLSPLPFLNFSLVVEACAIILPPIGLLVSLAKLIPEVVKERERYSEGGWEGEGWRVVVKKLRSNKMGFMSLKIVKY